MVVSDEETPGIPLKDGVSFIVSMIDIVTVSGAFIGCPPPVCRAFFAPSLPTLWPSTPFSDIFSK
ncbi:hypothetical protein DPMN_100591 [Dreissena polymorpha]|uniref:Uncharacterized protein n=1 Tax=Dreissena polymorpha TaxID=45954 RepID=A0A9D4LHU1_DREPO|nr:hypothetical protein DPMN_100591 [Dreissena polymorpha]